MKNTLCFLFISVFFISVSIAQSKKEVKKFKIKSSTETLTETKDGKEKTFNESFQRFDKNGNVTE